MDFRSIPSWTISHKGLKETALVIVLRLTIDMTDMTQPHFSQFFHFSHTFGGRVVHLCNRCKPTDSESERKTVLRFCDLKPRADIENEPNERCD